MSYNKSIDVFQHIKNLDVYGFTKLESILENSHVEYLKSKLVELYQEIDNVESYGRPARDASDKMVYNLQNKDIAFIELLSIDVIKKLLIKKLNDEYYRFLDKKIPNYILSYFNARSSGLALDLHIDSYIPNTGNYTWIMQVAFVLDDMTIDNGCTIVVPGSHLSGKYTDRDMKNVVHVKANAGDIIMWDSRLWHGTSENRSGRSRWVLIATISRWWVKQNMDITRSLPEHIYQKLSDEQKLLMGFCSIPPVDETSKVVTKADYGALKISVKDYYN